MPPINKQNEMNPEAFSQLQDSVTDMNTQVTEISAQMKEVYTAIVGDKKFGHRGLVERVENLESVKKKWENKVTWLYGYVLGAGSLITLIYEIIKSKFK